MAGIELVVMKRLVEDPTELRALGTRSAADAELLVKLIPGVFDVEEPSALFTL